MVAEFTLTHPNRSQLWLQVGTATKSFSRPMFASPGVNLLTGYNPLQYGGGTHAFTGSMALDLTDISGGGNRYFLIVHEAAAPGAAGISNFRVADAAGRTVATGKGLPITIDGVEGLVIADGP